MQHSVHRIHDPQGFNYLTNLDAKSDGKEGVLFGSTHVVYAHYDAQRTYKDDLILQIPHLNENPIDSGFVFTSGGERLFVWIEYRRRGSLTAGIVFEVNPCVLMFGVKGFRDVNGSFFLLSPATEVLAPSDGKPIRYQDVFPDDGIYFCVREGSPTVEPWAQNVDVTQSTSDMASQRGGILTGLIGAAPLVPQTAPLYFEVGCDEMPKVRINGELSLISTIQALRGN